LIAVKAFSNGAYRFSDFAECFPLFCEEDPETARNTYNIIADYIESRAKVRATVFLRLLFAHSLQNDFDTILQEYQVKPAVDDLFRIAKEGKARQANDQAHNAKDLWREDLLPAEAVAARTIPILEAEVERLRVAFSKVRFDITDVSRPRLTCQYSKSKKISL